MKKLAILFTIATVVCLAACQKQVTVPVPANALSSTDAYINDVLQSGHAAAVQYENDVKGGFVPAPAFKAAMKGLVDALNIADPLYQAYHETLKSNPTAAEPPALSSAMSNVSTALGNVSASATQK
jgi:hypothetical protein